MNYELLNYIICGSLPHVVDFILQFIDIGVAAN